jgi:hypothetical protein
MLHYRGELQLKHPIFPVEALQNAKKQMGQCQLIPLILTEDGNVIDDFHRMTGKTFIQTHGYYHSPD